LSEADKSRLELSCKLLDDLAALPAAAGTDLPAAGHPAQLPGVDLAQLRQALLALDPGAQWGGLRERELPENRGIVYLCHQHRQALRYPDHRPESETPRTPPGARPS
jgi:hypothetical protein